MERNVGFVEAIKLGFTNFFNFRDRAQRAEYWWWTLFTVIASLVLSLVALALGMGESGPMSSLFSLATFIPTLSVTARRLHDIGRSGWWQLLPAAPAAVAGFLFFSAFAGSGGGGGLSILGIILILVTLATVILLIVWYATDSDPQTNRFGPSPKYGSQASHFD